jgi:hypothetical protein
VDADRLHADALTLADDLSRLGLATPVKDA